MINTTQCNPHYHHVHYYTVESSLHNYHHVHYYTVESSLHTTIMFITIQWNPLFTLPSCSLLYSGILSSHYHHVHYYTVESSLHTTIMFITIQWNPLFTLPSCSLLYSGILSSHYHHDQAMVVFEKGVFGWSEEVAFGVVLKRESSGWS